MQHISDLVLVNLGLSHQFLRLLQVQERIFRVTYLDLDLGQVLESHTQSEALEIGILVISGLVLAKHQKVDELGNVAQRLHTVVGGNLSPDLLRVVEDLRI